MSEDCSSNSIWLQVSLQVGYMVQFHLQCLVAHRVEMSLFILIKRSCDEGSWSGPALRGPGSNRWEKGKLTRDKLKPESLVLSFAMSVLLSDNCFVYLLSYPYSSLLRLSLEVMTILCRCENIETSEGVPLYVTGVAQVIIHQLPNTVSDSIPLF